MSIFCWHDWETKQVGIDTTEYSLVLAWKQCTKCAASKLIHILA